MNVSNMWVRSYCRAIHCSVYGMRYDKGREHAGRADKNGFWLREFHAPAGVFVRLAGACVDGEMGP